MTHLYTTHQKNVIDVNSCKIKDTVTNNLKAAIKWHKFGYQVFPVIPGTKKPAVKVKKWLKSYSKKRVREYFTKYPHHEVGFVTSPDILVLDADSPESIAALILIEKTFGISTSVAIKTDKGIHHHYRVPKGVYAKRDTRSTKSCPACIDVLTGFSMVMLPPSTGKFIEVNEAFNADELAEATQEFVDAVFQHNGREVPRPTPKPSLDILPKKHHHEPELILARLKALLDLIDPDCGYEDWLHALMAIYHETGGSEDGFALADDWSGKGNAYKGIEEIETKWRSFANYSGAPITIATLNKMVADEGHNWLEICANVEPDFEASEDKTEVIHPLPNVIGQHSPKPLIKFSMMGMTNQLEKEAVEQTLLLGQLAAIGQWTVWYASPNTGKTLLVLFLLVEAVQLGIVDPDKVFYLNVDDTQSGLIEKNKLADKYGFHMISDGYNKFKTADLFATLNELIDTDQARGVVIILDTLKKFVDLMHKGRSRDFGKIMRKFVKKGGTCIALAHTNKRRSDSGKSIYAGTSDIKDDCDCVYILDEISRDDDAHTKVVAFENEKQRGSVVNRATYSYSTADGMAYEDLINSVSPVGDTELAAIKQQEDLKSDAEGIEVVAACIQEGITAKMKLRDAVANRLSISQRKVTNLIEKYTGTDPNRHKWNFQMGDRGKKQFCLLGPIKPPSS